MQFEVVSRPVILDPLFDPPELLLEFAGRVCYNSVAKLGYSNMFLRKRIEQGHLDIFEHLRYVIAVRDFFETDIWDILDLLLYASFPGVEVSFVDGELYMSVNASHLIVQRGWISDKILALIADDLSQVFEVLKDG